PAAGEAADMTLAFGSCARYQEDAEQPIWRAVAAARPDMFLWLGDNVYVDAFEPSVFDAEYQRQRAVPSFAPVMASVPQLAIWDDHDFGLNDHDRTNPVKKVGLDAFRRYWANPAYGTTDVPGVFFRQPLGEVDLFALDGRWHRDPNEAPDSPEKTMLGAGQLAWLKAGLKDSRATFKILACGSGWSAAKGMGGDSWASFQNERDALFDFIRDEKIGGVLLISGDTHVAELNAIPWSDRGGYDFYDLVSSPLAQPTSLSWIRRSPELRLRIPYTGDVNFGLLDFSFADVPTARFRVRNSMGLDAWQPFEVTSQDLKNGVASAARLTRLR
ncbi:MAG: alkaline phosphatase D family protein, partial [Pseudomonadota bacterium]